MKKKKIPTSVLITAIICIAGLEVVAMCFGINGKLFSLVIAAIAGIAGWALPQLNIKQE